VARICRFAHRLVRDGGESNRLTCRAPDWGLDLEMIIGIVRRTLWDVQGRIDT
jgi:hypothetical protein